MSAGASPAGNRPPLARPRDGRLVAGVCLGLADHLRVEPFIVRLLFVITTAVGGIGVLAYAGFWLLTPLPDPDASPPAGRAASRSRPDGKQLLALAAVAALTLVTAQLLWLGPGVVWPAVAATVGAALVWRQVDDTRRDRLLAASARLPDWATTRNGQIVRVSVGILLLVIGLASFLAVRGDFNAARRAVVPIVVVLGGAALVTGPWWLQTARDLRSERRVRIREQERVAIAGHIHDDVLQTLTLIQRRSGDPREVLRLARASERELRQWLYRIDQGGASSLRTALERVAATIEDDHGVPIEVVVVGDAGLDERTGALVQAAREAMVNAAKSSGASVVSVFAEVRDDAVQLFVRDRGRGFDLAAVPADRWGIRESIISRMQREHGRAAVMSTPGEGTEVRLDLPLQPSEQT